MYTVGLLALQGDFREHAQVLSRLGVNVVHVRYPEQLDDLSALVIPGGESTTFSTIMKTMNMVEPLRKRISEGLPVFGTCAGLILLAKEVLDKVEGQISLEVLDITVRRNAYGRQVDSFEDDILIKGEELPYRAIFIRAPKIESVGADVEVLAEHGGSPVLVRQGNILAATFHPELNLFYPEVNQLHVSGDRWLPYDYIHRYFLTEVAKLHK